MWIYALKSKGEYFERFKKLVKMQLEHKIKPFWSDNSDEFVFKIFNRFLKDHDIKKQTPTMYTPQQNGVAD